MAFFKIFENVNYRLVFAQTVTIGTHNASNTEPGAPCVAILCSDSMIIIIIIKNIVCGTYNV